MKRYKITQKAIDEWVYEEDWYVCIIASVPWYIESHLKNWYLVESEKLD